MQKYSFQAFTLVSLLSVVVFLVLEMLQKLEEFFSSLSATEKVVVGTVAAVGVAQCVRTGVEVGSALVEAMSTRHSDESLTQATPAKHVFPNYVVNARGQWLHSRTWHVPYPQSLETKPRGVVVLLHGAAEHIGRYNHVARFLNSIGLVVCGIDHHGHGLSDGERFQLFDFDHYVDDSIQFISLVSDKYCSADAKGAKLPLYLMGHSMGALIALSAAIEMAKRGMDSLVSGGLLLSAPPFGTVSGGATLDPNNAVVRAVIELVAAVFPKLRVAELDNSKLSHVECVLAKTKTDCCHNCEKFSAKTAVELIRRGEEVLANAKAVTLPYLLLFGTEDALCDVAKMRRFHAVAKDTHKDNEFHGLKTGFHEIYNETESVQKRAFGFIADWVQKRSNYLQ